MTECISVLFYHLFKFELQMCSIKQKIKTIFLWVVAWIIIIFACFFYFCFIICQILSFLLLLSQKGLNSNIRSGQSKFKLYPKGCHNLSLQFCPQTEGGLQDKLTMCECIGHAVLWASFICRIPVDVMACCVLVELKIQEYVIQVVWLHHQKDVEISHICARHKCKFYPLELNAN